MVEGRRGEQGAGEGSRGQEGQGGLAGGGRGNRVRHQGVTGHSRVWQGQGEAGNSRGQCVTGRVLQRLENLDNLVNENGHGKVMEHEKLAKRHGICDQS